jgi:hypothetical protein
MIIKAHNEHESESAGVLQGQLEEISQDIGKARNTFMSYQQANN